MSSRALKLHLNIGFQAFILITLVKLLLSFKTNNIIVYSVTRLCCNSVIFLVAYKTLPQFQGYRSKNYPGICKERIQMIEPRRMVLPPSFGSDWKKIGSRRTKMLMVQECSESNKWEREIENYLLKYAFKKLNGLSINSSNERFQSTSFQIRLRKCFLLEPSFMVKSYWLWWLVGGPSYVIIVSAPVPRIWLGYLEFGACLALDRGLGLKLDNLGDIDI